MLLNAVDINIHVGINDTPFSYASVDFPRAPLLCLIADGGSGSWGTVTRPLRCTLQYVTVANFRGTPSTTAPATKSIPFSEFTSFNRFSTDLFASLKLLRILPSFWLNTKFDVFLGAMKLEIWRLMCLVVRRTYLNIVLI